MTPLTFHTTTQTQVLTHQDTPLIYLTIALPQSDQRNALARRFNRYYQAQRRGYAHYVRHQLLPLAIGLWQQAQDQGVLFTPFTATLYHHITYQDGQYLSLYTQTKDNLPPTTLQRRGDTWDMHGGFLVPIHTFLPQKHRYKAHLATLALAQIQALETQGVAQFHPNIGKSLLKRRLNPHHYYLTPQGLCFFYPMYAIAPAVEQIPTFLCPLEDRAQ